jgi:hypothetical protein
MAHFAELDKNNVVLRVLVINDEHKQNGEIWCKEVFGGDKWKQTSYNGNIRKNYAAVGGVYDEDLDAFIDIKMFDSWILNEETCRWDPPVPYPSDGKRYSWNEDTVSWDEVEST